MLKENFTKTKAWAAYVREDIHFISEIPPVLRKIEFFLLMTCSISGRQSMPQSPGKAAIQC